MLGWDSLWHALIAFGAALGAGALNAIGGGGTNLSFPTLVWLGLPPVGANVTNAVALWPGSVSASWGFHREIGRSRRWLWLILPSLAGGGLGAYLLVHTPSTIFRSIAPFLVIGSSVLIAAEPAIHRRLRFGERSGGWRAVATGVQFVTSVYGGYFGAGLGILLLTALGLLGLEDIRQANGLKNLYSAALKGIAVVYFIFAGQVVWHAALLMAAGAIIGGFLSAVFGRKLSPRILRWIVVLIGIGLGAVMLVRVV